MWLPFAVKRSTSTVGLPRESKIWGSGGSEVSICAYSEVEMKGRRAISAYLASVDFWNRHGGWMKSGMCVAVWKKASFIYMADNLHFLWISRVRVWLDSVFSSSALHGRTFLARCQRPKFTLNPTAAFLLCSGEPASKILAGILFQVFSGMTRY